MNKIKLENSESDKIEILNTLKGMNGSMKEFISNLEEKFKNTFKSSAGKIYGIYNKSKLNRNFNSSWSETDKSYLYSTLKHKTNKK